MKDCIPYNHAELRFSSKLCDIFHGEVYGNFNEEITDKITYITEKLTFLRQKIV